MAGIRAYKLAEELGIERNDFVERALVLGIELKSAMAALDDDQADLLRTKLGGAAKSRPMEERRVERKGGSTVIRRRRKAEPEPVPAAEPEPVGEDLSATASAAGAAEAEPSVIDAAEEVVAPAAEEVAESVTSTDAPAPATGGAAAGPSAGARATPADAAGPAGATPADKKGKQRKRVREVVNLREQEQFARQIVNRGGPHRRTPAVVSRGASAQSPRRKRRDAPAKRALPAASTDSGARSIKVQGDTSVGELAKLLGIKAAQIQGKLMALGTMVSVNQLVDIETINKLAQELGVEVLDVGFKEEQFIEASADAGEEKAGALRPAVVTVMGHVDHGKTSLLDALRETRVVDGEAGGITQHIGAYQVHKDGHSLTFIDTPGHAAFTAMRARGAQVTDLVILVVAATDGVMPQTVEAIEHAQAAGCPIVVAINKCDLPGADPQQTRQRLMDHNLVPEDFGGDVICVDVSAITGQGLDQLLEMLNLQAEVLELRSDPDRRGGGAILEARLDKGRGVVATALVQEGTLKQGDVIVCGTSWGRVRVMENDVGQRVKEAGPAMPVQLIGLSEIPESGSTFNAVENERAAKQIVSHREDKQRSRTTKAKPPVVSLEDFFAQSEGEAVKELSVVLKADVHGTCEAVRDSLEKLSTDAVKLKVISAGVGAVGENDVMLASASRAIIFGFHVRPDPAARRLADDSGVDIRSYQVIYELIDDVKAAMAGLLPPTIREVAVGRAEVRETFVIPKKGTVAGCLVSEGVVRRDSKCRLVRDGVQIYEGQVGSLRRFKDEAREVQSGMECGIGIEGYNDVKVGDAIEFFDIEEEPATL